MNNMVEETRMKGDTLQVNFDDTGDHFILLWRDKVGQVHITGPGTFHSGDIKVINTPPKPTSPPEMPEDTAPIYVTRFNNDNIATRPPFLGGVCARFPLKNGKKEPNTCVGCTVRCPGKGQQEPPDEGLEPQEPTDEQKESARMQRERMEMKL